MTDTPSRGWVHVICGPMYSGKTEALLRLVRRLDIAGKRIGLFKPEIDTRTEAVTSRNGISYPSSAVATAADLYTIATSSDLEVVAIDEAQFFDSELGLVVYLLAQEGRLVLVSGLDRDFRGYAFGPMNLLLVEADEVSKLTAICFICKEEATLTQRLVNGNPARGDDPLIVVGGMNDDVYEARCRKCWVLG